MTEYKYSVALCTYNGEKYIAEQINSILEQTVLPAEIIISDDGSKDKTLQIADDVLSNAGIPYQIHADNVNHGVVGNFFHAFSLCANDIIFSCDQDDVWMPEKAETIIRCFNDNDNAQLVFTDGYLVDKDLQIIGDSMWDVVGISNEMLEKKQWVEYLLDNCRVTGATMAFKKSLLDDAVMPVCMLHDEYLALKAASVNGLVACPAKLIKYRQHGSNVVGMRQTVFRKSFVKWFKNFNGLYELRDGQRERWEFVFCNFKLSPEQTEIVQDKKTFWSDLAAMKNETKKRQMAIMKDHYKNGDYARFYCGLRGYVRDVILCLTEKARKNGID